MIRVVCVGLAALAMTAGRPGIADIQPELVLQSGHTGGVNSASFSPDGKRIVTASGDNTAIVWDTGTGQKLRTFAGHASAVDSASFSPDGKSIVTASNDATAIVWDTAGGQKLHTLAGHTQMVYTASFSPDGKSIVTASVDNTAIVWDAASGQKLRTLDKHTSTVSSASFSPDGRYIVTASVDNTAIVWDAATGQRLHALVGHTASVNTASFSPDGKFIVTSSYEDKTVIVWDVASGGKLRAIAGGTSQVLSASFSPDGKFIVTAIDKNAVVWDATSGAKLRDFAGQTSWVRSASFSPDGKSILTTSDREVVVWDVSSGRQVRRFDQPMVRVHSASFSPDGKSIVTATDQNAFVWDGASGQKPRTLDGHRASVLSASFSPDGKSIVTTSYDKTAIVWDAASGDKLHTLAGHTSLVRSASFSPDGKSIVTVSDDRTAILWDVASGQRLRAIGPKVGVYSASFSPDGNCIVTASDNVTTVWDATTGQKLPASAEYRRIPSAFFSPDRKSVLGFPTANVVTVKDGRVTPGDSPNTVFLYDVASRARVHTLVGHTGSVRSASFSPDGKFIVTASEDGTTRLWDAATGRERGVLISIDAGRDWLVVTPEGLFDGSLGGREKVSYRVGGGLTIVPLGRFIQDFQYPGLLATIHRGERPIPRAGFAVRVAPTVRFASPQSDDRTEEATADVVIEAVDRGGGVRGPYLYQSDSLLQESTDTRRIGAIIQRTFRVQLVEGPNRLEARASSDDGGWESEPARLVMTYDRPPVKPDLWVLAIGVNEYADDKIRLRYAAADARGFSEVFGRRGQGLYAAVHVTTLLDGKATRQGIVDALDAIAARAQPRDTFVVTVSGHGITLGQRYYFFPHEFRPDRYATIEESIGKQGMPIDELGERLGSVPALKRVLILDTCGAGGAAGLLEKSRGDVFAFRVAVERMNHVRGIFTIAACGAGEEAQEAEELGHGLLSYALLAGLRSVRGGPLGQLGVQTSNAEGVADVLEWFSFAANQTPALSKQYFGREQYVHMTNNGNTFPLLPLKDR